MLGVDVFMGAICLPEVPRTLPRFCLYGFLRGEAMYEWLGYGKCKTIGCEKVAEEARGYCRECNKRRQKDRLRRLADQAKALGASRDFRRR